MSHGFPFTGLDLGSMSGGINSSTIAAKLFLKFGQLFIHLRTWNVFGVYPEMATIILRNMPNMKFMELSDCSECIECTQI